MSNIEDMLEVKDLEKLYHFREFYETLITLFEKRNLCTEELKKEQRMLLQRIKQVESTKVS